MYVYVYRIIEKESKQTKLSVMYQKNYRTRPCMHIHGGMDRDEHHIGAWR
jgi:hypothetical protein